MSRVSLILATILAISCTNDEHVEISPVLEEGPVFVVEKCSAKVLATRSLDECIQIYTNLESASDEARPIKEVDKKIRSYAYENQFGVCGQESVDTLVFVHIVELVKIENVVKSFAVLPYPCI